ncbi:conserved hypothetical protein [Alteracholeplasma palmae J233]|uniref:Uncharacterized protein n=1 Tax=Alteracholeplasma palmae (strain ATCC 49389 / J233) TaxID=1318466 RepID=U4KJN1_ALTPJ|nr:ATP-binding protein [Alteracholeplasma palmae]CCV63603.1 conserved hypothetical protein [Alteracholeplasma palmae J233]
MENKINIRPTTGVYATYKNLRYEPWTAIAEFVDNSTQSFFDHQEELTSMANFGKLVVEITYEQMPDGNDTLTIKDNAYGMEIEDFERAIKIDKPPLNKKGRNEFGMGLKTAACWFGNFWSIVSTQLGSDIKYSASVNVEKISETHEDYIDYDMEKSDLGEHFTMLTISNLNKKITGGKTIGKVKSLLASIYREDLRRGDISIIYNGTELFFEEVEIYKEKLHDGTFKEWKTDIDIMVEHENQFLPVRGFVAIRQKGSVSDAGLSLLRRKRVIVGGVDQNYRPKEIFGNSNDFPYQRIFGELHMDEWKVTQAKDNFDWHNGGLEEKFIETLIPLIEDLIKKSAKIRVRQKAISTDFISKAVEELADAGIIENPKITFIEEGLKEEFIEQGSLIVDDNEDTSVIIEGPKTSEVSLERNGVHYNFLVNFKDYSTQWVLIKKENSSYRITLNMKHPFFKPLIDDSKFIEVMTKFVFSMAIAEIESTVMSPDSRIDPADIRIKMNTLLEESLKLKENELNE